MREARYRDQLRFRCRHARPRPHQASDILKKGRALQPGRREANRRSRGSSSHLTHRWREVDSNFRFPDAPSGRSAAARTFSSDREFAPLAWRDRDFEPPALAGWISALD
jgi:hypothetical protein